MKVVCRALHCSEKISERGVKEMWERGKQRVRDFYGRSTTDPIAAACRMIMMFVAQDHRVDGYVHILLITTGSVASVKAPLIVKELLKVLSTSLSAALTY